MSRPSLLTGSVYFLELAMQFRPKNACRCRWAPSGDYRCRLWHVDCHHAYVDGIIRYRFAVLD